jgi:hypothetical protein
MSQSPYSPPPYSQNLDYFSPQGNLLNAGRRAGTLMLVLGGLILLMGLFNTISSALTPADVMMERQKKVLPADGQLIVSATVYKSMAVVVGVATIITGLILVSLALSVRRGSKTSTIAGIVVTSLLLLLTGLMTLVFIVVGLSAPAVLPLICVPGGATMLLIWQLIWLIAAARNTTALWAAQQQYQMQYWQYQQNAQAYNGYGYGYGSQPITPPTPPSASESPPSST